MNCDLYQNPYQTPCSPDTEEEDIDGGSILVCGRHRLETTAEQSSSWRAGYNACVEDNAPHFERLNRQIEMLQSHVRVLVNKSR